MAHDTQLPEENTPFKSREEQEEDFKFLADMADKGCPTCFGRAYSGWNTDSQMYVSCGCVLKNIEKAMAEQNISEDKRQGILQGIRNRFGLN